MQGKYLGKVKKQLENEVKTDVSSTSEKEKYTTNPRGQ